MMWKVDDIVKTMGFRQIIYYHVSTIDGETYMALTEKAYWDATHALDDGYSSHYANICLAMEVCGQVEDSA